MNVDALPEEVLMIVFEHLSYDVLFEVVRVCKHWRELGDSPRLWRKFRLIVRPERIENLESILSLSRFKHIESIFINGGCLKLFNDVIKIMSTLRIQKVSLKQCNISEVCPQLLSETFSKLQTVNLICTRMSTGQSSALLERIANNPTSLKEMRFDSILSNSYGYGSYVDLSEIPPNVISTALNKIELLELGRTELTSDQLTKIFETMAVSTRLTNLTISGNVMSQVCKDTLVAGLSKVETISLNHTKLSKSQVETLLDKIISGCDIRNLDLTLNQVSGVSNELLVEADQKLESFFHDVDYDDEFDFEYYDGYAVDDELFDYIYTDSEEYD